MLERARLKNFLTLIIESCHGLSSRVLTNGALALVAVFALIGCASVAPTDRESVVAQGDIPSSDDVRDFEQDDLYRLLVAEIAAQRGELELALDN